LLEESIVKENWFWLRYTCASSYVLHIRLQDLSSIFALTNRIRACLACVHEKEEPIGETILL
jgi:hypothetical protein